MRKHTLRGWNVRSLRPMHKIKIRVKLWLVNAYEKLTSLLPAAKIRLGSTHRLAWSSLMIFLVNVIYNNPSQAHVSTRSHARRTSSTPGYHIHFVSPNVWNDDSSTHSGIGSPLPGSGRVVSSFARPVCPQRIYCDNALEYLDTMSTLRRVNEGTTIPCC